MMDWHSEIVAAHARITPHIRRTPVIEVSLPGLGYPVQLKLEQMQHTGSFKARGAFNTLLSGPVPAAGVVAASGGNHGAAVAFAARALGRFVGAVGRGRAPAHDEHATARADLSAHLLPQRFRIKLRRIGRGAVDAARRNARLPQRLGRAGAG